MHLFFTGPKRVGKSTLLNAVAAAWPGSLGGFRTIRLNTWKPGAYTVHLLLPEQSNPTQENLLFVCGADEGDVISRFDRLGQMALKASENASLILMDELGPHEAAAAGFQAAVRRALEGNTPILGVLQQSDSAFLQEVAHHPRVTVLAISEENRDALAEQIPEYLDFLRKG